MSSQFEGATQHDSSPQLKGVGDWSKFTIGALGVVYGDIGTSPLYAIKECFAPASGVALNHASILGITSLVFWALFLIVVVKYITFIMKADNRGEGGIMALLAMVTASKGVSPFGSPLITRRKIIMVGLIGTALLYGDGIITPTISVLSAVEGLNVATPAFQHMVVPITLIILVVLFLFQRRGTAGVGAVFGPVMLLWFLSIAVFGAPWILREPVILTALNPYHAFSFIFSHGKIGFLVLGAVILCVTGAEALYADMGHFGRRPIRLAWYLIVFPSLLLNYFGQGAMILSKGQAVIGNPFYELVPRAFLYPMVGLATAATVVASQALISGAFSMTQQAMSLGYFPRLKVIHTSGKAEGQIYIPRVNQFLMIACIVMVLFFRESSALAAAYGTAVTGTMLCTTLLFFIVLRDRWKWKPRQYISLITLFLIIDGCFFGANLIKIPHGGWVPLVIGVMMVTIMHTWQKGRSILAQIMISRTKPVAEFIREIEALNPPRVEGTAVFMSSLSEVIPAVMLHHIRHNKVLHEKVILLSIVTVRVPEVSALERVRVTEYTHGIFHVVAHYGYMQTPNVPEVIELCSSSGLQMDEKDISYFLGRDAILITGASGMSYPAKWLYTFLSRNSRSATSYFGITPDRVVELGAQIAI